MPSTFTTNTGIEKPGQGEQSGSWGITVNTNMDIVDRALNGKISITLTGTTSTLTTSDGSLSNGHYKVLVFGGVLAATHTITIAPADAQKIYYVKNETGQKLTFTQGAGQVTADVENGGFGIVFADGSDECVNLSNSASFSGFSIGGTPVTSSADEINTLDGFTGTVADLNYAKDLRATGVTADEFDYLDNVSSNIQTQLNGKQATITGAATTIDDANLTANRALISDGSGKVAVSSTITTTELGYLNNVSSNLQTQLNGKLALAGGTVTGNVKFNDSVQLNFGTGTDAEIYHNGSHLYFDMNADDDIIFRDGNDSNATRFTFDTSSGNFTATGNVTAYSDATLKSDITTIDSALEKVSAMRGVFFNKDGERGTGVVAQEVQKVIPEAVFDDGSYLSVAYGNLVGVLVEAVKELKTQVEELKNGDKNLG